MSEVSTPTPEGTLDLVVVGGGIAGLSAAWAAAKRGWSVRLLEAGRNVGGKIRSERRDGFLIEWGPSSFLGSAEPIWALIEDLHLEDQVVRGQAPSDRFIYRNRRARKLPSGPGSLLSGDYMTLGGKLRMFAEPFVLGDARPDDTVASFARRRLGEEAAQYLVTPFVSGIYAGDPDRLGARDAFPRLWQWEHEAGSVVMGALLGGVKRHGKDDKDDEPARPRRRGLYNFKEGFGTLPKALAATLPPGSVQTQSVVHAIERQADGTYLVRFAPTTDASALATVTARHVVVALPARAAAGLLRDVPLAQDLLHGVELCRVAVVHIGGRDPDGIAPHGFGILIPPGEGLRTLGILMPSSLFPGRAPDGGWLHTGFIGGALDPDAVDLPDDTLVSLVRRAQQQAFGHLSGGRELPCSFTAVVRWRDALPQYRVGHRDNMEQVLRATEATLPGLTLAGSHLQGVSVSDAAASGQNAVERLARLRQGG